MKSALSSKEIRQTITGVMSLKRSGQSSSATDLRSLVFGPADDATSNSRSRVAGWLRLKIICFRMHDDRPPDRRLLVVLSARFDDLNTPTLPCRKRPPQHFPCHPR